MHSTLVIALEAYHQLSRKELQGFFGGEKEGNDFSANEGCPPPCPGDASGLYGACDGLFFPRGHPLAFLAPALQRSLVKLGAPPGIFGAWSCCWGAGPRAAGFCAAETCSLKPGLASLAPCSEWLLQSQDLLLLLTGSMSKLTSRSQNAP